MAKIFFTSGTGYIGSAAARAAREAGHEVTALARSENSIAQLQEHGIKAHRGDIKQPQTYRDVLKNYDVVIHTAAVEGRDFPQVEEQVVNTVIEALRGTQKAFIYTSGVWVLGNTGEKPATEETPTNPLPLVAWRPQIEQLVVAASKDGIRTVVVRPALVYGNAGGILNQLYINAKKNGQATYIGNGENRWSLVHVEDLARLYVLAAEKAPTGSILHGSDNKPATQKQVAELIAEAAGVPGKVQGQTIEDARNTFGVFADGLVLDQHIDAPNTRQVLNWEPTSRQIVDELKKPVKQLATPRK